MHVVLWERFRAVFYTPFYAALALGVFEKEGLTIDFGAVPPGADVCGALRDAKADVAWGGPMRLMQDADQRPPDQPRGQHVVGFCEVVTRDPFFLVGRTPRNFHLRDLADLTLVSVSEVPTPWLCLQEDLRRVGIDPASIRRIANLSMPHAVAALADGRADVIQTFQPIVEELVAGGRGSVWYAAADRGLTSYTTFFATRRWLTENPAAARAMVHGMFVAQQWIHSRDSEAIATLVAPYFEGVDRAILTAAIDRYLKLGIWGATPAMAEEGFDRQAAGLVSGGFIKRKPAFDDCMDMTFAEDVVRRFAGDGGLETALPNGG
ncbi:ABC transporter substrate-binding protein [Fodinicurvata sp. EGI_FJ10296]|uniref:ABC transporter substrate-binding protein n=1 Tax=Fodinicurvata sp. EGI_FJ10296 TaxID=3231908 RepID=UPI003456B93C